ncbi:GNAT family N-acetyltransferase [Paenibacillus tritici]|uniref:GNAT family N-acetyltransferase n=1 Tax=Paenibacillus tritici TaxID=1873425 RepID=A0ABX2DIS6_9BACL|nr:GNAT family N-acetyltransferase [Paenibacillus tritici]NQX43953.1 GNAT family N-acetyltransferase [Paenibacillus tritici]
MIIKAQTYEIKGLSYIIRSAVAQDAEQLSALRLQVDGETENLDREQGEGWMGPAEFSALIAADTVSSRNLFLVADVQGRLAGFARCQGNELSRLAHQAEFGVGVLQEFWGYGMGRSLLAQAASWADAIGLEKLSLKVLETNDKAIKLYGRLGFEVEGVLRRDKRLADGQFYNTIVMGRLRRDRVGDS